MRIITFKAEDWLVNWMDRAARVKRLHRSEIIRAAVLYVLKKNLVDEALAEYEREAQAQRRKASLSASPRGFAESTEIIVVG